MPSREQIVEAFWRAVPAGAGWADLAVGMRVTAEVDGCTFLVDTTAEAAFRVRPSDKYLLILEEAAVAAAMASFETARVAA
jgi:hypothetical protein